MIALNVFHVVIHLFEILIIYGLMTFQVQLNSDYKALKSWIEWTFKMDLDKLSERIEEWKKEEGILRCRCGDIV